MSDCIKIDKEKCSGCGMCVKDCPNRAIELNEKKAQMVFDSCLECGHCVAICPKGAVSMNGYAMDEVKEYSKDVFTIAPESFLNSIKFRRSIRQFKSLPVEHDKIMKVIDVGRYTPTGSNKQGTRYIVVENPENSIEKDAIRTFQKIKSIDDKVGRYVKLPINTRTLNVKKGFFFHGAPAVILVISDDTVDAALASANMENMANALGLGVVVCWLFCKSSSHE